MKNHEGLPTGPHRNNRYYEAILRNRMRTATTPHRSKLSALRTTQAMKQMRNSKGKPCSSRQPSISTVKEPSRSRTNTTGLMVITCSFLESIR
ncbi:hypothetical protein B0O80DRAFT_443474 [Mortierella sp. GBAus27b]|nr:hypothetical protein B0O80DRAFT_443474 [Mortierella sp. GBAus27b]